MFFFQAEDGIRDKLVTGVQTCALPISKKKSCRAATLFLCHEDQRQTSRPRTGLHPSRRGGACARVLRRAARPRRDREAGGAPRERRGVGERRPPFNPPPRPG